MILLAQAYAHGAAPVPVAAPALDVAEVARTAPSLHDRDIAVRGRVAWSACSDGTCLVELVPVEGSGASLLVRKHGDLGLSLPAGKVVDVQGRFYTKIYPRYRLEAWQATGWHQGETLPETAAILRLDATALTTEAGAPAASQAGSIPAWREGVFDLSATEFEAGGMGTGRKCLEPGASTPTHSAGEDQELIFGLEGVVRLEIAGREPVLVSVGQGALVPAGADHGLRNDGSGRACYLFVFGAPAGGRR